MGYFSRALYSGALACSLLFSSGCGRPYFLKADQPGMERTSPNSSVTQTYSLNTTSLNVAKESLPDSSSSGPAQTLDALLLAEIALPPFEVAAAAAPPVTSSSEVSDAPELAHSDTLPADRLYTFVDGRQQLLPPSSFSSFSSSQHAFSPDSSSTSFPVHLTSPSPLVDFLPSPFPSSLLPSFSGSHLSLSFPSLASPAASFAAARLVPLLTLAYLPSQTSPLLVPAGLTKSFVQESSKSDMLPLKPLQNSSSSQQQRDYSHYPDLVLPQLNPCDGLVVPEHSFAVSPVRGRSAHADSYARRLTRRYEAFQEGLLYVPLSRSHYDCYQGIEDSLFSDNPGRMGLMFFMLGRDLFQAAGADTLVDAVDCVAEGYDALRVRVPQQIRFELKKLRRSSGIKDAAVLHSSSSASHEDSPYTVRFSPNMSVRGDINSYKTFFVTRARVKFPLSIGLDLSDTLKGELFLEPETTLSFDCTGVNHATDFYGGFRFTF